MSFVGIEGEINDHYEMVQFDWKIEKFFSLWKTVDSRYHSPAFDCWGKSFYLQMYPNGQEKTKSERWISLYLILRERCPLIEVKFQFAVKTVFGGIENSSSGSGSFARKGKGWGASHFLHSDILLQRCSELVPSGILTIAVTLKTGTYQTETSTKVVHVQTDLDYFKNLCSNEEGKHAKAVAFNKSVQAQFEDSIYEKTKDSNTEKEGPEKVVEDMTKLWHSGDNSDVVIRVRGHEFRAHKVILGARSPVLFAMFQHDTAESRSGEVKIEDCEPEVFREFLHYLYAGSPRELTSGNAAALYAVAEKYMAEDLKGRCLGHVLANLGVDTFCEAVALALKYGEAELLRSANDFASENIRQIVKSVQWQRFIQEEPVTANEILIKALGS